MPKTNADTSGTEPKQKKLKGPLKELAGVTCMIEKEEYVSHLVDRQQH